MVSALNPASAVAQSLQHVVSHLANELSHVSVPEMSVQGVWLSMGANFLQTGPSRALYLPRGLLDPQDIPSYLNGNLAGE